MNKRLISLMAAALALLSAGGQVTFTGGSVVEHPVIEITLSENHGSLNKIYVLYDTVGVAMTYTATTNNVVLWETYDASNWSHPDPLTDVRHAGMVTTLNQVIPDKGYIIKEGTTPFYCWVIDYSKYRLELNDLFYNNESPCNLITLNIDGHGNAIPYYEIDGHRHVLDREIKLTYNTLVWKEDSLGWGTENVIETFTALDQGVEIVPPLCDTDLKMTGDRFLERWNELESTEAHFETQAVRCASSAYYLDEQGNFILDDEGNRLKIEGELSGGSAPLRILFTGYPTDKYECNGAVVYRVWEMARDQDFEDIILQYNQDEVDYTFHDAGNYYVRYMVANADGSCEYYGDTYTINVSESKLGSGPRGDLPNAFSPGTTPGQNDIWKVTYKSLVEFHCWIYNRWGNLVYEYTDPDGGWDGTYRGKLVDTGVYYYVVTALGSDGVKYKKRGAISILRYKDNGGSTIPSGGSGDIDTGGDGF